MRAAPPPPPRVQRTRPKRFVELCCASAAVTLRLLGGKYMKPPVAQQGAKTGWATSILAAMGLYPGQGAEHIALVDLGPWAAVWSSLLAPSEREAVYDVLMSWRYEDEEDLWYRCRDKRPLAIANGEAPTAEEIASWLWLHARSFNNKGPEAGFTPSQSRNGVAVWGAVGVQAVAERVAELDKLPDVKWRVSRYPVQSVVVPPDGAGTYVYFDPPYKGTTGYLHQCERSEVIRVAQRWAEAGAVVAVSEAEPIPIPGWHHLQIDHSRRGQQRRFSVQQEEWLTLSQPPVTAPPKKLSWL